MTAPVDVAPATATVAPVAPVGSGAGVVDPEADRAVVLAGLGERGRRGGGDAGRAQPAPSLPAPGQHHHRRWRHRRATSCCRPSSSPTCLTHGQVTGWDPDWYDGFPLYTFYFPLPGMITVLFNAVVSYDVAFKLVTVLGTLTLPVCAWAFGRLAGLRDPGPACLAAATLPFLFEPSFTIYGGNILSTLAGEFSFSLSLSFALLFLGVWARGLRTGRHRALAARALRPHPALPPAPGTVRRGRCCRVAAARRRPGARRSPGPARAPGPSAVVAAPGLVGGGRAHRCRTQCLVAPALRHRAGLHHQHGLHQGPGLPPPPLPGLGPVGPGRRPGRPGGAGAASQPGGPVPRGDGGALGRRGLPRPGQQAVQRPVPALLVPLPLPVGRVRLGRGGVGLGPVVPATPARPLGRGGPPSARRGPRHPVAPGDTHQPVPAARATRVRRPVPWPGRSWPWPRRVWPWYRPWCCRRQTSARWGSPSGPTSPVPGPSGTTRATNGSPTTPSITPSSR